MLEIIALIWLWRVNGANARAKGQRAGKYRIITFALWFGLEFLGSFIGVTLCSILSPGMNSFMIAYVLGVLGAALGGFLSYQIAKNCPQKHSTENQMYSANVPQTAYTYNQLASAQAEQAEMLKMPATIRIIEQLGGYGAQRDQFYLNGQPLCSLAPGMGYEFKSNHVKHIITIGTPYCDAADTLHSVRFIASENGVIEVHAAAGKLIPELFKNYIS